MIIYKLALRGLVRNRKSSLVLIGLVAAGIFLFVSGDAFLGAAASGIRDEFQESSTGDIAVRARFDRAFGLMGFSIPSIGEYETIPALPEAARVEELLRGLPGIARAEAMVSGAALLEGPGGHQARLPVFGVRGASYFEIFPLLAFTEGAPPAGGEESWIVIPESRADEFEKAEGRRPEIGDSFQLTMATSGAFAIRAATLRGIVASPARDGDESAAVYVDPTSLRSLLGLATGSSDALQAAGPVAAGIDLDDFFSASAEQVGPSPGSAGEAVGLELATLYLADDEDKPENIDVEKGAWHFVIARLEAGASPFRVIAAANAAFSEAGIGATAVDWLAIAGMNASILFLLKTVFQIGMAVLAAVVVLVLANGLAFSVIEQTKEIGTMRALGAQGSFIKRLFFIQALLLVAAGTVLGILASKLGLAALARVGIPIGNEYLSMLFGTAMLRPGFRLESAASSLVGALLVAVVSSIYPMYLATRTSVAHTMGAE
ncbi:MAG: hypothetical protein CVV51_10485 [Spirochaetae bacterium HGW-Spirochaetae-7]|jgi:putative ABC transport system permease protein|nr:MAG: hypothetical protein CVV51_10485 [Spirochaetae bacterium HGW-Spirochaetae-7]